jgi:hypothetical protein
MDGRAFEFVFGQRAWMVLWLLRGLFGFEIERVSQVLMLFF